MKIAVIGWGSLIWDPRDLPLEGCWRTDGPRLPLEFARISGECSNNERLTLVIYDPYATDSNLWVQTLWNTLKVNSMEEALYKLCKREGTSPRNIGFIFKTKNSPLSLGNKKILCSKFCSVDDFKQYLSINEGDYYSRKEGRKEDGRWLKEIENWMKAKSLDGVVWTDLPSNLDKVMKERKKEIESWDENWEIRKKVEIYLDSVTETIRKNSQEYVTKAPCQIQTPVRKFLKEKFGWRCYNICQEKI